MSVLPPITNINITTSPWQTNFCNMIGHIGAGNAILYASADGHIHKFSCVQKILLASAVVSPAPAFGFGGTTILSNTDGDQFLLFDPVVHIFQLWDGLSLTMLHDYWPTFSAQVKAFNGTNILWSKALDSLWTVEGPSAPYRICRYRLTEGSRSVVSGVTVARFAAISADPSLIQVVYADEANVGTVDVATDVGLSSVAVTTIIDCGAAWDSMRVDPDGFIWIACRGNDFSGHLWKVDPTTLLSLGRCGNHNDSLHIRPNFAGVPVPDCKYAFATFDTDKFLLVGGDGYWDLAIIDRVSVVVLWNRATSPPLNANGNALFANNESTSGVIADGVGALWSFLNADGGATVLTITEIGISRSADEEPEIFITT